MTKGGTDALLIMRPCKVYAMLEALDMRKNKIFTRLNWCLGA